MLSATPIPQGPTVVVITLDTTRADRLGPYGYAKARTPTYDTLAARGTTFERAYAVAPLTIPSHSSIFTGRVPPSHGVRDNSDFVLAEDAITLAERFQDEGYATAAFTAAFPTSSRWGFAQGFDVYEDTLPGLSHARDWSRQRPANEVVDAALGVMSELDPDRPWFLWLHLFDAHWPYEPPAAYRSPNSSPYDDEIAFASDQVALFLRAVKKVHPDPVVLVTADHGESLGEGGEETHGHLLHDGSIRVPLILAGPGVPMGERRSEVVSAIDIAPTLLRLAGLDVHEEVQGVDLFGETHALAYSEALTGFYGLGLTQLVATTGEEGRFTRGAWDGFYPFDGQRIPTEPNRKADPAPHRVAHDARVAEFPVVASDRRTLDSSTLEALAALGYVSSGVPQAPTGVDPRDAAEILPMTWQARRAVNAGRFREAEATIDKVAQILGETTGVRGLRAHLYEGKGDPERAVNEWVGVHMEAPSSSSAMEIGELWLSMGDPQEAEIWAREALSFDPESPEPLALLVRSLNLAGQEAEARVLTKQLLAKHPDHEQLQLVMADFELRDMQPERALALAEDAARSMPFSVWASTTVARAHRDMGNPEGAFQSYRYALELAPDDVGIRVELTELFLESGRNADAWKTVRPLRVLLEGDPMALELIGRVKAAVQEERARAGAPPLTLD